MEGYDYDRGIYYIILAWVLTVIMLIAVGIRLYSRGVLTRSIGSDDFFIVIATCLSLCGVVQDTLAVQAGFGKHESRLTLFEIAEMTKWSFVDWLIVFVSYFFIRLSVMLFVLRLLPPNKKWATRIILFALFLNFAITIIATVSYGLHCIPFTASWTNAPGAKCQSLKTITITQQVNGILACVIDVITALVPQFLIWDLRMKRSTKLSLDVVFALGLITAVLSIGRVASMNLGVWATDTSWRSMKSATFSMVEEKCGIIFASAPAVRQFVAYRLRVGTFKPTTARQLPEQDFVRFRKRINLRDIFWYRQASLTDGRVTRPQRMFYPPTSDRSENGSDTAHLVEENAEKSALDAMTGKVKDFVPGQHHTGINSSISSNSLKTKLYDWNSTLKSNDYPEPQGAKKSQHDRPEQWTGYGSEGIRISHDVEVESMRARSRSPPAEPAKVHFPQEDGALAAALANPGMDRTGRSVVGRDDVV